MNKKMKIIALSPIVFLAASGLTSCNQSSDYLLLRVINSEDYIYLQDKTDPESAEDLTVQFEKSEVVAEFLKGYPQYKGVKVIYDTSDTNETLYSELQTGKSNYDLMNVSDYMAQKIVAGQMAVPLYRHNNASVEDAADYSMIENYQEYASRDIKERLDQIVATQKVYDKDQGKLVPHEVNLSEYAVGYMWGTLGVLFNPSYGEFASRGIDEMTVISDMQSFDALWDSKYNGTISIKNSMRDTYALGLMHAFEDEFVDLIDRYQNGYYCAECKLNNEDAKEIPGLLYSEEDITSGQCPHGHSASKVDECDHNDVLKAYQKEFSSIFNRCDEKSVGQVKGALDSLKQNIFGLEVDSGKQDIITKKIGVNLAWSGDAVYSMDQGEDLEQVSEEVTLYYSVPELGSNLWFDAWIMPKCERNEAQYQLAHLFLNFLSDPDNAYQNMEYTGYTSFIAGDSILGLVREWYDVRTEEIFYDEDYQIYSVNEATEEFTALDYSDFLSDRDPSRDEELLYAFFPFEEGEGEEIELIEEPRNIQELLDNSEAVLLEDEETQKKYGDLLIVDNGDYDEVDLSYFFKDTLNKDGDPDGYDEIADTVFYCEEYFTHLVDENGDPLLDENGDPIDNISVGRQFFCQYPTKETLDRCAVMSDYGDNNTYVMKMWENFKSDPLPVWAIVVFALLVGGALTFVALLVTNNVLKKRTKKRRIQNS